MCWPWTGKTWDMQGRRLGITKRAVTRKRQAGNTETRFPNNTGNLSKILRLHRIDPRGDQESWTTDAHCVFPRVQTAAVTRCWGCPRGMRLMAALFGRTIGELLHPEKRQKSHCNVAPHSTVLCRGVLNSCLTELNAQYQTDSWKRSCYGWELGMWQSALIYTR